MFILIQSNKFYISLRRVTENLLFLIEIRSRIRSRHIVQGPIVSLEQNVVGNVK